MQTIDNTKPNRTSEDLLFQAMLELNVPLSAKIAKMKPYYFVMRNSSMADDSAAVNFEQLFKSYSPDTILKVF